MRVCDVMIQFVCDMGVKDIFTVTGGGVMFMDDALACNKEVHAVCCHHEQAAAMAATAYAKYKGMGCALVTTGCGATNTVTGVLNAWQDNTPCLFIAGQCKLNEIISSVDVPIRQLGVQEAASIPIVQSITKYAAMIRRPEDVLYHLEKAVYLAKIGRPGPVWVEVPMGIQQAEVDGLQMRHFSPDELQENSKTEATAEEIEDLASKLQKAERPIILAGQGIRLSGSTERFARFIEHNKIPVVTARMGFDVLPSANELYIGRIGNKGTRAGNFAIQNADFVLSLGCRLSISTTGYAYDLFAREAEIYVVDIDPNEHKKNTVKIAREINADVADVLAKLPDIHNANLSRWAGKCLAWKEKYPVCTEEHYASSQGISLYAFMNELSAHLREDSVVVTDAGSAVYVPAQGLITTSKKQRYITSGGQAEMGFTTPGAVGVSVARGGGEVIGITGDGSFQMNIQELQTMVYHKLPVKLFVWNNDGYLSIRETQTRVFEGRYLGTDASCGVSFPSLEKIAEAYGIHYVKAPDIAHLGDAIEDAFRCEGPVLCEVMCMRDETILTAVTAKKMPDGSVISLPIEDMKPFLDRDEFYGNMIVKPVS